MSAALGLLTIAAALIAAAAAIACAGRREARMRRDILDDCKDLLDEAASWVAPSGYGGLRGRFGGRRAALTPIAEALAVRKLPQLWLAAAIEEHQPARPSIEIVRRPSGSELFAGGVSLPVSVRAPENWPQDTSIRASQDASALLRALEPVLALALHDPKLKAISIGPRGARVVRQAAQGARGAYVLFRDMRFDVSRIPSEDARAGLALARTIADRIVAVGIGGGSVVSEAA